LGALAESCSSASEFYDSCEIFDKDTSVKTCDASEQYKKNNNLFSLGDVISTKTVSAKYKGDFSGGDPGENDVIEGFTVATGKYG
jgi:hypothetical protein